MATLGKEHWIYVKRVFKYLRGRTNLEICYHENYEEVGVHGFVESKKDGDIDGRWSTSGYVFIFFGGEISWMRRKQYVVALSITEADYITDTHARKEAILMQQLCNNYAHIFGFDNKFLG